MHVNATHSSRPVVRIAPVVLIVFFMGLAMIPLSPNSEASLDDPVWSEGDQWAMGFEEDLSLNFSWEEFIEEFLGEDYMEEEGEFEDFKVDLDGVVGAYIITEVVEVNPEYKLKHTLSFALHATLVLEISGMMYKEGYYEDVTEDEDEDWNIPKTMKTMKITYKADIAVMITGYEYRNVDTLAISKQTYSMETAGKIRMKGDNMPMEDAGWPDYNYDGGETTWDYVEISYSDYNVEYSWEVDATLNLEYSPGLESEPPSSDVGDVWNQTYTVTTWGTYDGYIEASINGDYMGMDEDLIGGSSKLDITDPLFSSPPFVEGEIEETTEQVTIRQRIVDEDYVIMEDGTPTQCYVINQEELRDNDPYDPYDDYDDGEYDDDGYGEDDDYAEEPTTDYFYSPDHHRMVQIRASNLDEDYFSDDLENQLPLSTWEMTPQEVSTAQSFNRKHADPSDIIGPEEELNVALIGGMVVLVSIIGFAIFTYMNKNPDRRARKNGTSLSPIGPEGHFQQDPYSVNQWSNQQLGPAMNQTPLCTWCGMPAVFHQPMNQYVCTSCNRPLPAHLAPRIPPGSPQSFAPPQQGQPHYGPPRSQPAGPGTIPHPPRTPPNAPPHSPPFVQQQSRPMNGTGQGAPQGKWYCKLCGEKLAYTPQFNTYYCLKCKEFR